MPLSIENAVGQNLMLGFHGTQPFREGLELIKRHHVGGATLFRSMNLDHSAQIRELPDTLQRAATLWGGLPFRGQLLVELPEA